MQTINVGGVEFSVANTQRDNGRNPNRGRPSPKGASTKLPYNQYVWKLLDENMKAGRTFNNRVPLTDEQLVSVIRQEYGDIPYIRSRLDKNPKSLLSQARSAFNKNKLVADYQRGLMSISVNNQGQPVQTEGGRVLTAAETYTKIKRLSTPEDDLPVFMFLLGHGDFICPCQLQKLSESMTALDKTITKSSPTTIPDANPVNP